MFSMGLTTVVFGNLFGEYGTARYEGGFELIQSAATSSVALEKIVERVLDEHYKLYRTYASVFMVVGIIGIIVCIIKLFAETLLNIKGFIFWV
jgi:hypothetical protein